MSIASLDPPAAQQVLTACAQRIGVAGAQLSIATPTCQVDAVYGITGNGCREVMATDVRSQVGSFAKVLTAVLVHQLVDDGRLALDADVADLATKRESALRSLAGVEVGHLLAMTSGLDWGIWTADVTVRGALLRQLTLPRRAPSGSSFGYTFASTLVAGRIVELMHGMPWWGCVAEHVAFPLGLRLTGDPASTGVAPGLEATSRGWSVIDAPTMAGMAPTGTTLASSAADLARLATALCHSTSPLLSAASRMALHTEVVPVGAAMVADAWCHGPYSRRIGASGRRLHGHGGRWAGGLCDVTWDAESGTSVAITTNTPARGAALVLDVSREVHRQLWGEAAFVDQVEVEPAPDMLALEGRYVTANRVYDVRRDGQRLIVDAATLPHPDAVFALPEITTELMTVGPRRFLPVHETREERRLQEFWFSDEAEPKFFYDGFVGARRLPASATTAANASGS